MIVLDTHAWIWWVDQSGSFGTAAQRALREAEGKSAICVSSMSVWEVQMLVKKGRLRLKTDVDHWVRQCELSSRMKFVPVDNEIARLSVHLPDPSPADPADRIVIATALALGASLVSKDEEIRRC